MDEKTLYDVAIIGGGLAGLSLSIQCAEAGFNTILFEKEQYPFHRVCGEYISLESWDFLQKLGVPLQQWKLPQINKLLTTDAAGNAFKFNLDLGGFGVSRYKLDEALYNIALAKGVRILTQTKVISTTFNKDHFQVQTTEKSVIARVVAASYGKRSNLDVKWNRPFILQKRRKLNNYIGVKYHITYPTQKDTIALHNFKNGYCGMSAIEDGKSCLCYLTTAANLQKAGNSIEGLQQKILSENPALKTIFENATYLYCQPLSISQVSFANKKQVENNVLMLGDAAGMITPLCGNGMSMALHAGKLAFLNIIPFLKGDISREQMEKSYENNWQKQFAKRLWVGRRVQQVFGGRLMTSLFLRSMKAMPALAKLVIGSTHGKPF